MTRPYSPLQEEANQQTLFLMNEIGNYQRLFNYNSSMRNTPGISSVGRTSYISAADGWNISYQTIDGDFDLDDILAREIASRVASNILDGEWLKDYLTSSPGNDATFDEYTKSSAYGPGNIVANVNQVRTSIEGGLTSKKIADAVSKIEAKKLKSVKINNHMTLYNGNKSGKGPVRLRIRISDLQAKVVTPAVDPENLRFHKNGKLSVRANAVKNPGGLAGMTSKMRYLNLKGVGGALTFAPTAAVDLYQNFNDGQLDGRQFVIDQAKHQSGNLAGWVIGCTIIVAGSAFSAPVLLIGFGALGVGIIIQAVWNYSGMAENAGKLAEEVMDAKWTDIDSRFLAP